MGFFGAAQIVRIERERLHLKQGKDSRETVYAITSAAPLLETKQNAAHLLALARNQWIIENGNHYMRDRSYDEDRCPVRHPNAARILATLRSLAGFLTKRGVHRPRCAHQQTVPSLHRYANAHRCMAIRWIMAARLPA
jgi:hypothetical protein